MPRKKEINFIYSDDEINDQAIEQCADVLIKYQEALNNRKAFKNVEMFIIDKALEDKSNIININGQKFKIIKFFNSYALEYINNLED